MRWIIGFLVLQIVVEIETCPQWGIVEIIDSFLCFVFPSWSTSEISQWVIEIETDPSADPPYWGIFPILRISYSRSIQLEFPYRQLSLLEVIRFLMIWSPF